MTTLRYGSSHSDHCGGGGCGGRGISAADRAWVHSGQLGQHTLTFTRAPLTIKQQNSKKKFDRNLVHIQLTNDTGSDAASGDREEEGSIVYPQVAAGNNAECTLHNRSEAEDMWSCCGRTVAAAGRGCELVEPTAKVGYNLVKFIF